MLASVECPFWQQAEKAVLNHSTRMKKQSQTEHVLLPSGSPCVKGFNKIKT